MLGVVLWSDYSDRKAVIWCEDQGDLAYVNGSDDVLNSQDFFDAGDLVQFDMEMHQSTRHASNARLLIEKAGSNLPQALLQEVEVANQTAVHAEVVPFPRMRVTA